MITQQQLGNTGNQSHQEIPLDQDNLHKLKYLFIPRLYKDKRLFFYLIVFENYLNDYNHFFKYKKFDYKKKF